MNTNDKQEIFIDMLMEQVQSQEDATILFECLQDNYAELSTALMENSEEDAMIAKQIEELMRQAVILSKGYSGG